MTEPPSRQYEAHLANNGGPHDEYDPHGVAARDMVAECPDCAARDGMGPPWYGSNPWSAPTTAQSLDFVMESGTNILGVCGASPSNKLNNYNTPLDGHWGMSAKTTYKAGDVIDLAWCVSVSSRREHHKFSHPDTHSSIPHRRTTAASRCLGFVTTKASCRP